MKKVVKYRVLHQDRVQQLEAEVNRLLKEGWELHGGLCHSAHQWSQALVLKEGQDTYPKMTPR